MNVAARMLQPHILLQESSLHIYIEVVNTRKVKTGSSSFLEPLSNLNYLDINLHSKATVKIAVSFCCKSTSKECLFIFEQTWNLLGMLEMNK